MGVNYAVAARIVAHGKLQQGDGDTCATAATNRTLEPTREDVIKNQKPS